MSLENNKIIFNNINQALVNNSNRINLDINQFKEPPAEDKMLLEDKI